MAWKASHADLLHDFAHTAFLFLLEPIVQEYVDKNQVQANKNAV